MKTFSKGPALVQAILIALIIMLPGRLFPALDIQLPEQYSLRLKSTLKAYYLNDQRIQWSGMEATFAVEGILHSTIEKAFSNSKIEIISEFYFNQPYGKNRLSDMYRDKYLANFERANFQIAQLSLVWTSGDIRIGLGKHNTLFGRAYNSSLLNSHLDAPFIRTEAIKWYETGFFLTFNPGLFKLDLAVVNGDENQDTNSSKALILRLGLGGGQWGIGVSAKMQDGIGSEDQKQFNNHIGADFILGSERFNLSGEFIYDEYGFRRPFDPQLIFWPRSFYYRDVFYKIKTPVSGLGGYLNINIKKEKWAFSLNYSEYHPKKIDIPFHDEVIRRGFVKAVINLSSHFELFAVGLIENKRESEPFRSHSQTWLILTGFQFRL